MQCWGLKEFWSPLPTGQGILRRVEEPLEGVLGFFPSGECAHVCVCGVGDGSKQRMSGCAKVGYDFSEGRPGISYVSAPCLESQGCQFDPTCFNIVNLSVCLSVCLSFRCQPYLRNQ